MNTVLIWIVFIFATTFAVFSFFFLGLAEKPVLIAVSTGIAGVTAYILHRSEL